MELLAKYYDGKNSVLFFDDNQIICTIDNGSPDIVNRLIDTIEESKPEEIVE